MKTSHQLSHRTILSRHARARMQQRSIPPAAVELLLDYATAVSAGGGATCYRFTRGTWAAAAAALGPRVKSFEKFRNAYVIESCDGVVVTAAWLH